MAGSGELLRKRCYLGLILIGIALCLPAIVNVHNFGILKMLEESIVTNDGALLIYTAARLVFLNTLRALPLYLGVFLLSQALSAIANMRMVAIFFPIFLIPLSYQGVGLIHNVRYDLGMPALLIVVHILILGQIIERLDRSYKKSVVISLFLFGVQWLDVTPLLSNYGFGRGEISTNVKLVAQFLEAEQVLSIVSLAFAFIFVVNTLLVTRFMIDQYKQAAMFRENQEQAIKLQQLQLQSVQARTFLEVQQLAHDLKSPLTTIQGLASLLSIMSPDHKTMGERISNAADSMSILISEILNEDKRRALDLHELVATLKKHLVNIAEQRRVVIEGDIPQVSLWANNVRLTRAIINVIENGLKSNKEELVVVKFLIRGDLVVVQVIDQGGGIAKEWRDRIWEAGFSTKPGATGLGLSFARDVVNSHNGQIDFHSEVGLGTSFFITLPVLEMDGGGGDTTQSANY